jgi:putative peptidoglycan binding protein
LWNDRATANLFGVTISSFGRGAGNRMHPRVLALASIVLLSPACSQNSPGNAPANPPPPPAASPAPAPPRKPAETSQAALVKSIQIELIRQGFYAGTPDGIMGPKTSAAIKDYQKLKNLPQDGMPTQSLLDRLKS